MFYVFSHSTNLERNVSSLLFIFLCDIFIVKGCCIVAKSIESFQTKKGNLNEEVICVWRDFSFIGKMWFLICFHWQSIEGKKVEFEEQFGLICVRSIFFWGIEPGIIWKSEFQPLLLKSRLAQTFVWFCPLYVGFC